MEKVKEKFCWPGYEKDVAKWIAECQPCQQRNAPQPTQLAPLGTVKAAAPFEKISWDIMGPLPETSQATNMCWLLDLFTKHTEAFPLKVTDSETLAKILVDEVISCYRVPSTLHSDQGTNLTSKVISSLCDSLGITQTRTTAYHPQGNAQVERFNCTLENILAKVVSDNQHDWGQHLPQALLIELQFMRQPTSYTPFHVTCSRSPTLPVYIMIGTTKNQKDIQMPEFVHHLHRSLNNAYSTMRENLHTAHQHNKARYDRSVTHIHFSVGNQVWLYVPAVKKGRTKKFSSLWHGPYILS